MSHTFTKLFSSITESTIWVEDAETRIVWITMLAMADHQGRVWGSIPGLANRARVSVQAVELAIEKFLSPDKYSRTPDNEGRRVAVIDGGWLLLNYMKYREIRPDCGPGANGTAANEVKKVYFVRCGGRIKIGISKNPWARLNSLKTAMPETPVLLGYMDGTLADESALHERFKALRVNLEWFEDSSEIAEFIQKNCTLCGKDEDEGSEKVATSKRSPATGRNYNKEAEAEAEAELLVPNGTLSGAARRDTPKEAAKRVLAFLNDKTGKAFQPTAANLDLIVARLKEGYDEDTCRSVIARKFREWKDDDKMRPYLRPATLFNREKFNQYAGECV